MQEERHAERTLFPNNINDDDLLMFQGCIDDFHCANQGRSPLVNSLDEAREFSKTRRALSLLGERVDV